VQDFRERAAVGLGRLGGAEVKGAAEVVSVSFLAKDEGSIFVHLGDRTSLLVNLGEFGEFGVSGEFGKLRLTRLRIGALQSSVAHLTACGSSVRTAKAVR